MVRTVIIRILKEHVNGGLGSRKLLCKVWQNPPESIFRLPLLVQAVKVPTFPTRLLWPLV
jgi:hypothetical protein